MAMHMGHVALRVTDLERAAAHAKLALGLREVSRTDDEVLLTSNHKHHELQLLRGTTAGLDHVGLELESDDELARVREQAIAAGGSPIESDGPQAGIGEVVRIVGPLGIVHELYTGMKRDPLTIGAHLAAGIRRFGHVTFLVRDPAPVVAFWRDGLGFRLSDTADGLTWMRCDVDHHGMAVGVHPDADVLHHHAWEVQDIGALAQYCDDLGQAGLPLLWGPVRHGPGFNLATYLPDTEGGVIEVYTDLIQVHDDAAYEPIDWSEHKHAINLWGPSPSDELQTAGVPILPPGIDARA